MTNYNVYLSSTFRDLEEHRKAVLKLFQHISDHFQVTAMEGYTAEDKSALEKCIGDVEKCDLYILFLANRYGHIPLNNEKNQNPDRRSITEIEYRTAVSSKKKRLVYLADINNKEGVLFAADDESPEKAYKIEMLSKFRSSVAEERLTPRPFAKAEDLSSLVAASIINLLVEDPMDRARMLDESLKYCCDRSPQYTAYEQNRISGSSLFHVFVTTGHQQDSGGNLVNRCAIYSMNLPEEDIHSLAFEEFYNQDSYEKNREQFIYQVHKKICPENSLVTPSIEELKKTCQEKKAGNLLFRINCYEEFLDEERMDFLVNVFGDLHRMCMTSYDEFKKRIYFFLNIEDSYEDDRVTKNTKEKINLLKKKADALSVNFFPLPRFSLANRENINTWIENYITKDQEMRDELFDIHFKQDLPASFRLRTAEKSIRRLFNRIRDEDPDISNILKK